MYHSKQKNVDNLIVAGHDPDSIILLGNKIHFIFFENTEYNKEDTPEK